MSVDPPPSLLITPDTRRRLSQRYEEATRLAAREPVDFRGIHELLAECLRTDPGNILYLNALLANLRRWGPRPKWSWLPGWLSGLSRSGSEEKSVLRTQHSVPSTSTDEAMTLLRYAPNRLLASPTDTTLLLNLAAACETCDLPEAELLYLQTARDLASDHADTLRMLARSLTRQGRFNDAVGPWFAVLALSPDREAEQAVEDLRGSQECIEAVEPLPEFLSKDISDAAAALRSAQSSKSIGALTSAEQHLIHAQTVFGGDLAIWHEREELQLARSALRLEIARRRATSDSHPRAKQLVQELEVEHNRLEIDIFHLRSEREPGNSGLRLELARRLKQAGNYSGAIQRLEEARNDPAIAAAVLLELGECWQHLRQFAKALDFYQQAIAAAEQSRDQWSRSAVDSNPSPPAPLPQGERGEALQGGGPLWQAALYRIGVLAAAMNDPAQARSAFERLMAANPGYKDARPRLDKLP